MSSVIEAGVWDILSELYVIMAGEVVEYPVADRRASIQPLIQTEDAEGNVESRPQLQNVPVLFLSGGGASHTVGLSPGDEGILFFNQRSIDRFLEFGREVDPQDARMFHFSDAFFLPCSLSEPASEAAFEAAAFTGMTDRSAGYKVNSGGSLEIFRDGTDLIERIETKAEAARAAVVDLLNETAETPYSAVDPTTGVWNANAQGALKDLRDALDELSNAANSLRS